MKSWMDELTENELEVMRVTLKCSIDSPEIGLATRQHAAILLAELEDYLWNSVCRNTPANLDQLQTGR